jgi:hypothetical protein
VRGVISEIDSLGRFEIRLSFDPSMLRFESGRRLGLFSMSTVFFGDQPGGILVISGSVPAGSPGISGEGDMFELSFTVLDEEGDTTIEGSEAELFTVLGPEINAGFGESVDLSIEAAGGSSVLRPQDSGSSGKQR